MTETTVTAALVDTRNALHRVAEHVLSAARKIETGHISLEQAPGGFATPPLPDGRVIAVEGRDIVVRRNADVHRARLTTVRSAAELAGIAPGFPWTKHPPATALEPDEPLTINADKARVLADWYALGRAALDALADRHPEDEPSHPSIYPEHFDLAISAAEINYGFSPGDANIPTPYVYVGPFEGPMAADNFWNAPFGAYRSRTDIRTTEDAIAFLVEGREHAHAARLDRPDTTSQGATGRLA